MTFMKSAGEKIFGSSSKSENDSLNEHIKQIGGDNLQVAFNDGTVTVTGKTASQADKEKLLLALGNVDGVEKVDEKIEVENPDGSESEFYTVKKGDNLSKIAQHFYHKASAFNIIFEANKPMLTHPDKIYPGQVLRIPKDKH